MALKNTDIQEYLQIAPLVKNLPSKPFWLFYDTEADVLYINFHSPAKVATDSEATDDDVILRYEDDEIIGITILDASQR